MYIFHCLVRFEQIWNASIYSYFSVKVICEVLLSNSVELLREEVRTMGKTENVPDEANMRIKKKIVTNFPRHHRSMNTFEIVK